MLPDIPPGIAPIILVGIAMLLLAAWLLVLDAGSRANRAFALILALRGSGIVAAMVAVVWRSDAPRLATTLDIMSFYATIPVVFAIAYFLSVFPVRRGPFGTATGPWVLLGCSGAALAWFFADHGAYSATGAEGQRIPGPLFILGGLVRPAFALAAFILARDYRRQPHGSRGFSLFLVAAALAINAVFDGTMWLIPLFQALAADGWAGLAASLLAGGLTYNLLAITALPIGAAALVEMARAIRHELTDSTLQEARRFLTVVVPITVLSAFVAGYSDIRGWGGPRDFLLGFWRLIVPALIAYALLRFSLFDADIKVKAGVKRAIILTAFALVFFVVSESAEALLSEGRDATFGIVAAVLLVLVSQPLQRVAQKAANAVMPDTKPIVSMSWTERQQMYKEQYQLVEHDGTMTPKERRMLERLGGALGFSEDQTRRLEAGGRLSLSADDIVVQHGAPSRASRKVLAATMMAVALGALGSFFELVVDAGDFVMGLAVAGAITVLLTPLDKLASRLTEGPPPKPPESSLSLYEVAVRDALADGHWTHRERVYLAALAERLGIDHRTRKSLHAQTRKQLVSMRG